MSKATYFSVMPSPVGPLTLTGRGGALTGVRFASDAKLRASAEWTRDDGRLVSARSQFEEYFAGERAYFELELAPEGTPFQHRVWEALACVPFGATASYGDIARAIGNPAAVRAVGAANGRNPLAIVVPCHRIIGADGSLTGYGGGLHRKRWLVDFEQAAAKRRLAVPGDASERPPQGHRARSLPRTASRAAARRPGAHPQA